MDPGLVLPVAEGGEGGDGAARVAGPVRERRQVAPVVADVAGEHDDLGPLAVEVLERGARRARDAAVQVNVGEASDADTVERAREAGDRDVVPGDVDRGGLDEEALAQGGRAEGARRRGEEVAAGQPAGCVSDGAAGWRPPGRAPPCPGAWGPRRRKSH